MTLQNIYDKFFNILKEQNEDSLYMKLNNDTTLICNLYYTSGSVGFLSFSFKQLTNEHITPEDSVYNSVILKYYPENDFNFSESLDLSIRIQQESMIPNFKDLQIRSSGFEYFIHLENNSVSSIEKTDEKSYLISAEYDNHEFSEESIAFIVDNISLNSKDISDMYNLKFDYVLNNNTFKLLLEGLDELKNLEYKAKTKDHTLFKIK